MLPLCKLASLRFCGIISSLTTEGVVSWEFKPAFDSGHLAALAGGKNLVYVSPPAWWATLPLFDRCPTPGTPGQHTLVLASHAADVTEAGIVLRHCDGLGAVHAATGLARTVRLLTCDATNTVVTSPSDALALFERSALKAGVLKRIVIAWPEMIMQEGAADQLDAVLAETAGIQRIVITSDQGAVGDFVERHARRAPMVTSCAQPEQPTAQVRYSVANYQNVAVAVHNSLDILDPGTAIIWDPRPGAEARWREFSADPMVRVTREPGTASVDLAIAAELPTAEALDSLAVIAGEILTIVRASQIRYLQRITERARFLQLPSEVDRVRDRAARLRDEVRDLVIRRSGTSEILALAPLFDTYDPATIASALAADRLAGQAESPAEAQLPTWVRLHANVGRINNVTTGDIVGAILNQVGIAKRQVGKVELRDKFSLIEVRAEVAQRVLRGFDGLVIKGKKVTARIDRR